MLDEGYIKYHCYWQQTAPLPVSLLTALIDWRDQLYARELIGYYPQHRVGYGNISIRHQQDRFIISGSQTGHIALTNPAHYSRVDRYDISQNQVWCSGPVKASSETLTHAAVYELSDDFEAVIHVHSLHHWQELLWQVPTTRAEVAYGTPQMAAEVARLYREDSLAETRLFVMAGHEEGIVSFGNSLEEAAEVLYQGLGLI